MIKTVRSGGYMFTPARWTRPSSPAGGSIMKLLGFLNLRGISGQIAALVVASIVAMHLILTTTFLIHRPDQPDPPIDRGHDQLAAAAQLLGAAPAAGAAAAARRYRAGISATRDRKPAAGAVPPRAIPDGPNCAVCVAASAAATGSFRCARGRRHQQGRHRAAGRRDDFRQIAAGQRPRPFWGGPWMMTLMFAVISVTLLGLWAARALTAPLSSFAKAAEDFSLNGAAAPLPERGPEEIRSVAKALNRMRERITGPDRRPHQDAGRHQPRPAHADHPDAAARRIHRGRGASQPHAARSRPDALDAGSRALASCATTASSNP